MIDVRETALDGLEPARWDDADLVVVLGGPIGVGDGPVKEIGWSPLTLTSEGRSSPLRHLDGLPVLHWHGDRFELPAGAASLASTAITPHQAFSVGSHALALQFHPEVDPAGIERWLIGHAAELAQAGVDLTALRHATRLHGQALERAAAPMMEDWLNAALNRP